MTCPSRTGSLKTYLKILGEKNNESVIHKFWNMLYVSKYVIYGKDRYFLNN